MIKLNIVYNYSFGYKYENIRTYDSLINYALILQSEHFIKLS